MARERVFNPDRLDVAAFAAAGGELAGELPQARFSRLQDSLLRLAADTAPPPVVWSAAGQSRPAANGRAQVWLWLRATTRVTLECQRCLQPLQEPVSVNRWFRFVADEDEAARLDEESEEDELAASAAFGMLGLLEDELILALPIVPRHEVCPQPWVAPATAEEVAAAAPHPFAALAGLRRPERKE